MIKVLAHVAVVSICLNASAQLITQQNPGHAVPDHVIYRLFLQHLAAFTAKADALDAAGQSGEVLRRHLEHKYSLTPDQLASIHDAVMRFKLAMDDHRAKAKAAIDAYRAQYMPRGRQKGDIALPPSADLEGLKVQRKAITMSAMSDLHTILGDHAFTSLVTIMRARIMSEIRIVSPQN